MISRRFHLPIITTLAALACGSLACSVQLGGTLGAINAPAAKVMFVAPANNTLIAQGATVEFAANATDSSADVSKIEFVLDDALSIGSLTASAAQTSFTASQGWTAQGIQGHLVTARAYRADGSVLGESQITVQVLAVPNLPAGLLLQPTQSTQSTPATVVAAAASPSLAPTTLTTIATDTTAPTVVLATDTLVPPTLTNAAPGAVATNTPTGPTLRVTYKMLNIRSGPSVNFAKIGELKKDDVVTILGRNNDSTWWFISQNPAQGWVIADITYSQVSGDTSNVPLVASSPTPPPPTANAPTQALAPTSTPVGSFPDLIFDSVTLNPTTPTTGQTFTVTIVIRNQGPIDTPRASFLTGTFQPGNEESDSAVPVIKAGETATITLPVTVHSSGVNQTAKLTLDARNELNEGPNGKANDAKTLSYNVN